MPRKNPQPAPPEVEATPKKRSRTPKAESAPPEAPVPVKGVRSKKPTPKTEPAEETKAVFRHAKKASAVTPEPVEETKALFRRPKKAPGEKPAEAVPVEETKALFRRPKGAKTVEAVSESMGEKPRRGPVRSKQPAAFEPSAAPAPPAKAKGRKRPFSSDDDLPVPIWRPRTDAKSRKAARDAERNEGRGRRGREAKPEQTSEPVEAVVEAKPKRGRRRRGDEEETVETTFREPKGRSRRPEPETPAPLIEELPKPPPKPIIAIPEDAPQVVVRGGVPSIVRKGKVYPPISFFGSAHDERRSKTVLDEVRLAAENGVHIHVHLVELEVDPEAVGTALSFAGYMLKKTLEVDPEAQVLFRVVFVAPSGWARKYPDGAYQDESGRSPEPSLCDDEYWGVARDCLTNFVQVLRLLDDRDHILGLHLERGEWFFADGAGYDTSRAAVAKFRDWARTRYLNDFVALRAAWFDSVADFENLQIPKYRHPSAEGEMFVRSSRKERRWVDYHLFLSDSTVARIGDLAYAAKEASEGYFLIGVSYGYTFEWSHPSSGHLSLGKLLRTREVDFIAGPPSYRSREPGGAAPFPSPIDSYALNGKIYISEEDFKTAIGDWKEPDDFNPVIRTPQALESVHWRGAGSALAHASGINWMDLWGNGWLKTSTIWQRGAQIRDALTWRMGTPLSDPDVAVFIDERALAYLVDQASFALLVQNVRESVLRAGVSAGFYLLSDLTHREHFPESKLYIFLNAWDVRSDLRDAIKNRLQRDGKLLFWLYAAGLFESGREALERAREVTGVALKPQPFHSRAGTTILNRKHSLSEAFPDRGTIGGSTLDPTYFAIPEESTVLGEYTQTGLPSFVIREFGGPPAERWTSVFMGEPVVTPALVRALGQLSGSHIWNYQDDVVHVRPPFLTVHCQGSGPRAITLPSKWSAYSLTADEWVADDAASVRFNALDGATYVFLVGTRAEIETILQSNPEDYLRMDEIPKREDDTVRFDAVSFDVPIMKLGEWMEGGSLDDVSEDWLLHPKVSDFESDSDDDPTDEPEPVGRRRRRRKVRNGDRDRDRGGRAATAVADDLEMNIMFRKRE